MTFFILAINRTHLQLRWPLRRANLFFQGLQVEFSIGKIHCSWWTEYGDSWNLPGLSNRRKTICSLCNRSRNGFANESAAICPTSLCVSMSTYSSVLGTFPRTEYVGLKSRRQKHSDLCLHSPHTQWFHFYLTSVNDAKGFPPQEHWMTSKMQKKALW